MTTLRKTYPDGRVEVFEDLPLNCEPAEDGGLDFIIQVPGQQDYIVHATPAQADEMLQTLLRLVRPN